MSYFGENYTIKKTVVVKYFTGTYETPAGLTGMLADNAAHDILEKMAPKNRKKYGRNAYGDPKFNTWKAHKSRLRKIFYRRALPIIEKMFELANN